MALTTTNIKQNIRRLTDSPPVALAKRLMKAVGKDDISGLSAELSYRFFLSLFPFFIFLAALGAFIADQLDTQNPTDEIMNVLGESIPEDVASVLRKQIDAVIGSQSAGLLSIGIAGAMWTASSGIQSLIKGMNRIYAVTEQRAVWKRWVLAVGLVLLAGNLLIVGFLIMVVGQVYGLKIAEEIGLEGQAAELLTLARLPLVIAVVLLATDFLYWAAPNAKLPFRLLSPGSALFTLAWLALNAAFGLYIANFGSYNATYGALGSVVVVLLWFYLTSFILLLGAEVNAVALHELDTPPERRRRNRDLSPDTPVS